jgi:hypothetical protein
VSAFPFQCSDFNISDDDDEATASCPFLAIDASISTVVEEDKAPPPPKSPLAVLPEGVLAHCSLTFLGGLQDRHALPSFIC